MLTVGDLQVVKISNIGDLQGSLFVDCEISIIVDGQVSGVEG